MKSHLAIGIVSQQTAFDLSVDLGCNMEGEVNCINNNISQVDDEFY